MTNEEMKMLLMSRLEKKAGVVDPILDKLNLQGDNRELAGRLMLDAGAGFGGSLLYELINHIRGKKRTWTGRALSFLGGVGASELGQAFEKKVGTTGYIYDRVKKAEKTTNDKDDTPYRDEHGNVMFPGFIPIYDNNGGILRHAPIGPSAAPGKPIGKPLTVKQVEGLKKAIEPLKKLFEVL
jgi:hypothetical protein